MQDLFVLSTRWFIIHRPAGQYFLYMQIRQHFSGAHRKGIIFFIFLLFFIAAKIYQPLNFVLKEGIFSEQTLGIWGEQFLISTGCSISCIFPRITFVFLYSSGSKLKSLGNQTEYFMPDRTDDCQCSYLHVFIFLRLFSEAKMTSCFGGPGMFQVLHEAIYKFCSCVYKYSLIDNWVLPFLFFTGYVNTLYDTVSSDWIEPKYAGTHLTRFPGAQCSKKNASKLLFPGEYKY